MNSPSVVLHGRFAGLLAVCAISLLLPFSGVLAEQPLPENPGVKPGDVVVPPGALQIAQDGFTPWMSLSELNAYMEGLDGDKPTGGKNFWDRGNWINEVEGRWEKGIPQYRIAHGPVPEARAHFWNWYINQDRQSFDKLVGQLADEGYVLVQYNSYTRPGGSERFQGVWHRLVPLTHAALFPAGRYRLSEMDNKPVANLLVSLVIDGDQISGHGPSSEFKGSVRDRFSGKITASPSPVGTALRPYQETEFLAQLEYGTWSEKNGALRVTKNGQTVLRFEPDKSEDAATPPKPE